MPTVAIITPTRNRLGLLREAMDSVAAQTCGDWEHIIVDDGSTDGTDTEVSRRAKNDPRIRYIARQGAKSGANVCRNIGINAAASELVVFLDSDDLIKPNCLARRVEVMQRNADLDFAVFRGNAFQESPDQPLRVYHPHPPGDDLLRFLMHECIWEITSPIWRRQTLLRLGAFDEDLLSMQDLELHVRAIAARSRYICFEEIDHDIRWQADAEKTSVLHFRDSRYLERATTVRSKMASVVAEHDNMTWSRRRALTGLRFATAELWSRSGHLSRALQEWRSNRGGDSGSLLHWSGCTMLLAARTNPSEVSPLGRAINKWKGWMRFRQEPSLLNDAEARGP